MSKSEVIVITGANGHLGKYLVNSLANSYSVISITRDQISERIHENNFHIKADLSIKSE